MNKIKHFNVFLKDESEGEGGMNFPDGMLSFHSKRTVKPNIKYLELFLIIIPITINQSSFLLLSTKPNMT